MKMIEIYYRLLLHDRKGKIIKDTGEIPSHSYVIQFLELINGYFDGVAITATDVNGAESTLLGTSRIAYYGNLNAPATNDTFGIVVGTNAGLTPVSNTDYKLDTKILHGSAIADKLKYGAVTFTAPAVVEANIDMVIVRTFINDSGGTITVKEIGIICKNTTDTKYHLLLRDVVADEAVLDGYTLTVTYTLRTTV
jgi:hypothetical protein